MSIDLSAARWFKSSFSANQEACVEAAHLSSGEIGVRDSKDPTGPTLIFGPTDWDAFLTGLRSGTLGRP
ncbi:DUF397 domain-containing protein [Nocardia sp. NPDC050406]|uniref:DUF397 domain-containing protein n=1 Tax=Nocardia sp. NPDC050406 TaxID=3364318 RepID=UPI0037A6065E